MTGNEQIGFGEIVRALYGHGDNPGLIAKVDRIDQRLDRWDGAVTFVKAAAGFVGLGGLALFVRALAP